jgi:hypothetical protein
MPAAGAATKVTKSLENVAIVVAGAWPSAGSQESATLAAPPRPPFSH